MFANLGKVDLLLASPECTNHSVARGSRPVYETSRSSGWLILPFLERLKPRWIVLENVGGMTRWDGFVAFKKALQKEGYRLRLHRLDSADYGVPQQRRRVFIVGDRLQSPRVIEKISSRLPASSIIDRRGTWKTSPLFKPGRAQATLDRAKAAIKALGEGIEFLVVYYGSDKGGEMANAGPASADVDDAGSVRPSSVGCIRRADPADAAGAGAEGRHGAPELLPAQSRHSP